jgi:hypothetical protein
MLLEVKGGLSRGGVGICRMGSGGALLASGSVTPGMLGIRGGKESAKVGVAKRDAHKAVNWDVYIFVVMIVP